MHALSTLVLKFDTQLVVFLQIHNKVLTASVVSENGMLELSYTSQSTIGQYFEYSEVESDRPHTYSEVVDNTRREIYHEIDNNEQEIYYEVDNAGPEIYSTTCSKFSQEWSKIVSAMSPRVKYVM